MTSTASLADLAAVVARLPSSPGRGWFDNYLAPSSLNPRKSTDPGDDSNVYVFVDKHNHTALISMFLYTNTLSPTSKKRSFTQLGEYFNLYYDDNMQTFPEDKFKSTRLSLCCDFVESRAEIPDEVWRNSSNALKSLRKLQKDAEARLNRQALVESIPSSLIRPSITGQDAAVTVLHSEKLFNLESVRLSNVNNSLDGVMKQTHAIANAQSMNIVNPVWLHDMPDSRGLYKATLHEMNAANCIFLQVPDIYDLDGVLIQPADYQAVIGDRQLVFVECSLKMWHFAPGKTRTAHSRVYHSVVKEMHLLRTEPDEHKASIMRKLVDRLARVRTVGVTATVSSAEAGASDNESLATLSASGGSESEAVVVNVIPAEGVVNGSSVEASSSSTRSNSQAQQVAASDPGNKSTSSKRGHDGSSSAGKPAKSARRG
ncbi:hypothetical protein V5O48_005221 [Marasmius crinis-equi]|uniref:Uncharacterized protein n=1 Tax=Marasmius crinis-equi TaxID=585013 RepID=A0ABR3FNB0_9AGAR